MLGKNRSDIRKRESKSWAVVGERVLRGMRAIKNYNMVNYIMQLVKFKNKNQNESQLRTTICIEGI